MSALIKFFRLNRIEKREFLYAFMALLWAKWMVVRGPFSRLNPWMGHPISAAAIPEIQLSSDDLVTALLIKKSIARCQRLIPWRQSACLVNALAAKRRLRSHRIPSFLFIGAKKSNASLLAHAWLTTGTLGITGVHGSTDFTPTAVYGDL